MTDARIDLHLHSHHSDGSESPAVVVQTAHELGIDVVALTDHDTTAGWDEARRECDWWGMSFVPGIELSASVPGGSVHVLAYGPDPRNADLSATCARIRESRESRIDRMIDAVTVDYPEVTRELVYSFVQSGATLGRPVIARALVSVGIVETVDAAFASILAPGSSYYATHFAPSVTEAIGLIRAAGGVPIMAHPWTEGRTSMVFEEKGDDAVFALFADLKAAGLAGLEIDHTENTARGIERMREFARRLDFIVTGSSDYHGRGMKTVMPGARTTAPDMLDRIVAEATGTPITIR